MSSLPRDEVQIVFLASLRETVGRERGTCAAQTLADVLDWLRANSSDQAWQAVSAGNVRVAVNQHLVSTDVPAAVALAPGDEVAFLPPVTGG